MSVVMISALYVEAYPLIQNLNLRSSQAVKGYSCFENEEKNLILVITGTGKIRMAGAVASVLQLVSCDHLIFFSSCAGLKKQKAGDVFLVNKVTDLESGRSYYPDLLYQSDLPEASLLCGEIPFGIYQKNRDLEEPYDPAEIVRKHPYDLYDMDTSGGVWTAEKFLGPHQITILKTVTDHGTFQDRESYEECMETGWKRSSDYVRKISDRTSVMEPGGKDIRQIADELHCSVTMEAQLRQLYRYADASDQNILMILKELEQEGWLPCKDREEGKKVLHELTGRLTA